MWSVSLKLSCAPHRRRNTKPSIPLLLGTSERNGGRGRKNHSSSFFFPLHTDSPLSPLFLYSTTASTFILFPTLPPSFASSVRPKVHPPPPYPRYHHLPPPPPIPGGESCVGGGGGGGLATSLPPRSSSSSSTSAITTSADITLRARREWSGVDLLCPYRLLQWSEGARGGRRRILRCGVTTEAAASASCAFWPSRPSSSSSSASIQAVM